MLTRTALSFATAAAFASTFALTACSGSAVDIGVQPDAAPVSTDPSDGVPSGSSDTDTTGASTDGSGSSDPGTGSTTPPGTTPAPGDPVDGGAPSSDAAPSTGDSGVKADSSAPPPPDAGDGGLACVGTMEVEPNDALSQANAIQPGTLCGTMNAQGDDNDYFKFSTADVPAYEWTFTSTFPIRVNESRDGANVILRVRPGGNRLAAYKIVLVKK